jgi:hypothetical protein
MNGSKQCKQLRKRIAAGGPAALRDDQAAQEHLVECPDCYAFLEALAGLERAFQELPPIDAPDEVVESLLSNPELSQPPAQSAARQSRWQRLREWNQKTDFSVIWKGWQDRVKRAGAWMATRRRLLIAAGAPLAMILLLVVVTSQLKDDEIQGLAGPTAGRSARFETYSEADEGVAGKDKAEAEKQIFELKAGEEQKKELQALREVPHKPGPSVPVDTPQQIGGVVRQVPIPDPTPDEPAPSASAMSDYSTFGDQPLPDLGIDYDYVEQDDKPADQRSAQQIKQQLDRIQIEHRADGIKMDGFWTYESRSLPMEEEETFSNEELAQLKGLGYLEAEEANVSGRRDSETLPRSRNFNFQARLAIRPGATEQDAVGEERPEPAAAPVDSSVAREFLARRQLVDNLAFKEPRGYWANTYVPGDRDLRLLQARLIDWDRSDLETETTDLRLHEGSRQVVQPFDPPANSALTVYLNADRRGINARSRLLVAVGLKATSRHSGRRPAMNAGLVLDLRGEVPVEVATAMRAVVDAFARARDMGDRFTLTVAGRPGGVIVPHGDFRYGPLRVAMDQLFAEDASKTGGLSLPAAYAQAVAAVSAEDDPTTPLGSSVVILVTGQTLGHVVSQLASHAYASAVEGVPLSVVGIGSEIKLDELDQLVLAGQGNRRLLYSPAEAEAMVDRELSAVGNVIVRAVRLRLRLAPGVQLVDVVGSHRLDEARAQEVRDAETSIDRRLSRNLGITADRGLDEEGIQIVIPTFYAGDSHVVLLDLVAPGPGAIVDATVRYKDLVYLRNGLIRDNLSLGRYQEEPGPLQLNVLKNLLAHRLGDCLDRAGSDVENGYLGVAKTRLAEFRDLLRQLPLEIPGLESDPDLANDIAMLDEYLALLDSGVEQQRDRLAESMRYASRAKLLKVQELVTQ